MGGARQGRALSCSQEITGHKVPAPRPCPGLSFSHKRLWNKTEPFGPQPDSAASEAGWGHITPDLIAVPVSSLLPWMRPGLKQHRVTDPPWRDFSPEMQLRAPVSESRANCLPLPHPSASSAQLPQAKSKALGSHTLQPRQPANLNWAHVMCPVTRSDAFAYLSPFILSLLRRALLLPFHSCEHEAGGLWS